MGPWGIPMALWRVTAAVSLLLAPLGAQGTPVYPCVVSGSRYHLMADSVNWSMRIASGESCIRGLRFNDVLIEDVRLVSPPRSGALELRGPGFIYSPRADFQGDDSFAVVVSGSIKGIRGHSTIQVTVSVDTRRKFVPENHDAGPRKGSPAGPSFLLDGAGGYVLDSAGKKLTPF
jgi:hypothetical protein